MRNFATSDEGQAMLLLHQMGYQLAPTLQALTPGQSYYLLAASMHQQKLQSEHLEQMRRQAATGGNHG